MHVKVHTRGRHYRNLTCKYRSVGETKSLGSMSLSLSRVVESHNRKGTRAESNPNTTLINRIHRERDLRKKAKFISPDTSWKRHSMALPRTPRAQITNILLFVSAELVRFISHAIFGQTRRIAMRISRNARSSGELFHVRGTRTSTPNVNAGGTQRFFMMHAPRQKRPF